MKPEDVQRLHLRREHLKLRLRRQQQAREVRALARRLCAAGVRRFSRVPSLRILELAPRCLHLPGRDERFYWPEIPGGTCEAWRDEAGRDALFARALRSVFAPASRLLLVFHTHEDGLVLGLEDAVAHARLLLEGLHGTLWVIPKDASPGLVEVSFSDDEVCWLADNIR